MTRIDHRLETTTPPVRGWRVRAGVAVLSAATVAALAGCGSSS